jgi:hypothetical protein
MRESKRRFLLEEMEAFGIYLYLKGVILVHSVCLRLPLRDALTREEAS